MEFGKLKEQAICTPTYDLLGALIKTLQPELKKANPVPFYQLYNKVATKYPALKNVYADSINETININEVITYIIANA